MASVVTVDQVRDYLSSPPWSAKQEATCALEIATKQSQLERFLQVPIDPVDRTDNARILPSGLVCTDLPVYTLIAVDSVPTVAGVPPIPYTLKDGWLYGQELDTGYSTGALNSRPFSLVAGGYNPRVLVHYLGGWGGQPDITGAIIRKVAAVMLNRHDDTVVARNLDAEKPKEVSEAWTDQELLSLRSRKRPAGVNRRW